MIVEEEEVFISEVEVPYLLLSTSECSPLFIDCNRWVSTRGNQICKKHRSCVNIRISNYHSITEHVTLDNNDDTFQT